MRALSFMWRKHHFLVPISMWRHYLSVFREKSTTELEGRKFLDPRKENEYRKWLSIQNKTVDHVFLNDDLFTIIDLNNSCSSVTAFQFVHPVQPIATYKALQELLLDRDNEWLILVERPLLIDDTLLNQFSKVLSKEDCDYIYCDHEIVDEAHRPKRPVFKGDFSYDTLRSFNYMGPLIAVRRGFVESVSADQPFSLYDLLLRLSEVKARPHHIAECLYHQINEDVDLEADGRALNASFERQGIMAALVADQQAHGHRVQYLLAQRPLVSIIIPTKDHSDILQTCLHSIYSKSSYENFEVVVMDNNSFEAKTAQLFEKYESKHENFRVIKADFPFNYSKINNLGVAHARGEFLILLNNDTEVLSSDWIEKMLGFAQQDHVGAVGAKLLFPDHTIQHAGIVTGVGGLANHVYLSARDDDIGIDGRLRLPYNYVGVTAACLMVQKNKYKSVGGLDEALTVAFNDVDFNLKLVDMGLFNVLLPEVKLIHAESRSRGKDVGAQRIQRFRTEHEIMLSKWGRYRLENDVFYNKNFSKFVPYLLDESPTRIDEVI